MGIIGGNLDGALKNRAVAVLAGGQSVGFILGLVACACFLPYPSDLSLHCGCDTCHLFDSQLVSCATSRVDGAGYT